MGQHAAFKTQLAAFESKEIFPRHPDDVAQAGERKRALRFRPGVWIYDIIT